MLLFSCFFSRRHEIVFAYCWIETYTQFHLSRQSGHILFKENSAKEVDRSQEMTTCDWRSMCCRYNINKARKVFIATILIPSKCLNNTNSFILCNKHKFDLNMITYYNTINKRCNWICLTICHWLCLEDFFKSKSTRSGYQIPFLIS